MSAEPAVSIHSDSQAFSRTKGVSMPQQWPGICPQCILPVHGDIRVGPDRGVVAPCQPLGNAVPVNRAKLAMLSAKLAMLSDGDKKCKDLCKCGAYTALQYSMISLIHI